MSRVVCSDREILADGRYDPEQLPTEARALDRITSAVTLAPDLALRLVAQRLVVADYGSEGRGFESSLARNTPSDQPVCRPPFPATAGKRAGRHRCPRGNTEARRVRLNLPGKSPPSTD
jgi:hypothetical protein